MSAERRFSTAEKARIIVALIFCAAVLSVLAFGILRHALQLSIN